MACRSEGHEVVSVVNGLEALKQLAIESFDLIISDILMPEMDGFQLCRTVKLDEHWNKIPFIFYTATYTSKEDEQLALSLGASRFIVKPVEPEEFLAVIEQVVHEGETKKLAVPVLDVDTEENLGLYRQVLVRKLERKIEQLEAARAELAALLEERNREAAARLVAEEALMRSQNQLQHAQRLESIGRLAGGAAHDFNNLLTVITGYNQMTLTALESNSPLYVFAEEIRRAAERAASLTHQLLAFSRKQVFSLRPVNINAVVMDAHRMLQHMIGEDIQLGL
jgi:CheY-like chemotaxis protein